MRFCPYALMLRKFPRKSVESVVLVANYGKSMWKRIACKEKDIQLNLSLTGGQSFRWKYNKETGEFIGVFARRIWKIKQDGDALLFKTYKGTQLQDDGENKPIQVKGKRKGGKVSNGIKNVTPECNDSDEENILRDYLRLDVNLDTLYNEWGSCDPLFANAARTFFGIRILKQDPIENIFSFICATNNHISRISSMVEKLCFKFGSPIAEVDGATYYSFPVPAAMTGADAEQWMRDNGFGYRAKYIRGSAEVVAGAENGEEGWLKNLLNMDYGCAKEELIKLPGIGAKVADCICLMSLGHLCAVPVDTHVHQIAVRHYTPHLAKCKTVTPAVYNEIGNHFRNLYGDLAGWAHTILFCADLKMFKDMTGSEPSSTTSNKRKKQKSC